MTKLTFKPVTPKTLADFEALFNAPSAPKYCWCMAWRAVGEEMKHARSSERHDDMVGRIEQGVPVGLVGYDKGEPTGWVSIAPKETFRKGLANPEPDGDAQVWSLVCMFLPKERRQEGLGGQLVQGAIAYAKKRGATVVEAYPIDPDSPSYRFMGFVPAFEKMGFKAAGKMGSRRHVMRLEL